MLITIRFPLHTVVMVILFATTYPRISLTEGRNPVGLCFSCCCDPICKQSRNCYSRNEDWNTSDFRCIEFPNKVDGSHAGGYIMLAECPSNWNGTVDKAAKCALKKVNINSLAGLRSIDLTTNFTYPNSYCAQCNNTLHDYVYYTEIPEVHTVEEKPEEKMDVCYHKCIIIPKTEPNSCPQIQQPCSPNEPSETFWSHICIASSKREVPTSEQPSVPNETTVVATSTKATKQCNGSAFPPEEFVLWPNNSVFVSSQNKIYDNNSYILVNKTLIVCSNSSPTSFPRSLWSGGYPGNELDSSRGELNDYKLHQNRALDIVNYVGFSMSITALLFLLLTYFLFAELRTYPGKTVMHLSCALIAMQLTYLVSNEVVSLVRRAVLGVLFHYFILAVFLWTSVIAHDTQKTFTALRVSPKNILVFQERKKAYIGYCVFSWGIPFIVVGICVTLDLTNTGNVGYGAESACRLSRSARLYAISIPVSLLLLFNLIALIRTVVAIKLQGNMRVPHKKKLPTIVLKLVVIMGMTWIPGIAAAFLPNPNLEYPFFVLNSLQGVLIFFSFLCKRQIITLYKQKFARSKSEIPFVVSANTTNSSKVSGYSRESCM